MIVQILDQDHAKKLARGDDGGPENRVVLTPVAGAKLSVAKSIRPDSISYQAGSDGDKTNSLAEESAV